jgi:hypothetical protein
MNDLSHSRLINEILLAIDRKDPPLWSLPLIADLESQLDGGAMKWAMNVIESQLYRFTTQQHSSQHHKWISDFRELSVASSDFQEIIYAGRTIWYADGTRDAGQTAIARLYEGLAGKLSGNALGYQKALAMAIQAIVMDENGQPLPIAVEKMIEMYLQARLK